MEAGSDVDLHLQKFSTAFDMVNYKVSDHIIICINDLIAIGTPYAFFAVTPGVSCRGPPLALVLLLILIKELTVELQLFRSIFSVYTKLEAKPWSSSSQACSRNGMFLNVFKNQYLHVDLHHNRPCRSQSYKHPHSATLDY